MKLSIISCCVLATAIGIAIGQNWTIAARAGAPIVRATYQGVVAGVNDNVAAIWLLGNDGTLKICTQVVTNGNVNAPVCSSSATP